MAALGFTFRVLPDVWLMHWPHHPQAAWAAHPFSRIKNVEANAREAMQQVGTAGMEQRGSIVMLQRLVLHGSARGVANVHVVGIAGSSRGCEGKELGVSRSEGNVEVGVGLYAAGERGHKSFAGVGAERLPGSGGQGVITPGDVWEAAGRLGWKQVS